MQKLFDLLGKLIAIVWLISFVLWATNANWGYLNNYGTVVTILNIIHEWGALVLVGVVGFEAVAKRKRVTKIIYLILLAICIVFSFFPGVIN